MEGLADGNSISIPVLVFNQRAECIVRKDIPSASAPAPELCAIICVLSHHSIRGEMSLQEQTDCIIILENSFSAHLRTVIRIDEDGIRPLREGGARSKQERLRALLSALPCHRTFPDQIAIRGSDTECIDRIRD